MSKTKLYVIIVAYNSTASGSDTVRKAIRLFSSRDVIIVDNSTIDKVVNANRKFCRTNKITYMPQGDNVGLSKAYNNAIKYVVRSEAKQTGRHWIMTLDQDTSVSEEYLHNVKNEIEKNNDAYPVMSGEIKFDGYIGSPVRINQLKPIGYDGVFWDNAECINTALVLRLDVVLEVGMYDERLFLDQVDRLMLWKLRQLGYDKIRAIKGAINQSFSGDSFGTLKTDMRRFSIYKRDTLSFINVTHDRRGLFLFSVMKRWLRIRIHHALKSINR